MNQHSMHKLYMLSQNSWSSGNIPLLSGGFSVGWPVAGMGMLTDPDHFGMF